jgi:hypothetical protein
MSSASSPDTSQSNGRNRTKLLLTAVTTGLLLAACWWGYWLVADMLRKPPFRGTLIAELRILAPIIVSFVVLSLAQLVHNRFR